jgi:hypothetical protein
MKAARPTDLIDVQALRVGMFVHLDVGWMSHPFPLSSFRITSAAQVEKIRALGLRRVRWSPQDSRPESEETGADDGDGADPGDGPDTEPGCLADAANDPSGKDAAPAAAAAIPDAVVPEPPAGSGAEPPACSGAERARAARAQRLLRAHDAERLCERQYAEAARACRQTLDIVVERPQQARAQAEALAQAVIDKMIGEQDLCIRMLTEAAGDKASMHAMNVAVIALLMGRCFGFADEDYALVVAVNASRPLKPSVLVHDAGVPRPEALVLDLESLPGLGIRRSIRPQQLPPTALDYLAPSARVAYFFEPSLAADDFAPSGVAS